VRDNWKNPFSASGPVSDSASPGMLSVGAVDPPMGSVIGAYSSEGPTNDGRIKPDISAAACVKSFTYSPDCFSGTSSAAPVVAGAAALLLDTGAAVTPAQVASYLKTAVVERGAAGPDNIFGTGELRLPSSPPQPPRPAPTSTPVPAVTQVPSPPPPVRLVRPDTDPPGLRAFASKGRRGGKARLRYRLVDNSRRARVSIRVYRRGRLHVRFGYRSVAATGRRVAHVWRVRRTTPRGRYRFCVTAVDATSNKAAACARLRIR
jgi:hypothetical protein